MGQHRAPRGARRASSAPRATVQQDSSISLAGTTYSEGGKRRAESGPGIPGLPSAPVVAGVAALAISAGGAAMAATTTGVIAAAPDQAPEGDASPAAQKVTASPSVSKANIASLIANRREVVSRDHSRTSGTGATTTEDLQKAASEQVAGRDAALAAASTEAQAQSDKIEANQWVLPTNSGYRLTARYHQAGGYWSSGFHTGLDFADSTGTPLVAVANGTITESGYDGSYGNKTVLTLDDGTEIWYCHQSAFQVSVGDRVTAGDVIGLMGATGNVTGPHLHLEIFEPNGNAVDPYQALVDHGVTP